MGIMFYRKIAYYTAIPVFHFKDKSRKTSREEMMIYIGSVSTSSGSVTGRGKGIYTVKENSDHSMTHIQTIPSDNAGIITASADGRFIYAANESKSFGGINGSGGGVSAYRILEDGTLSLINDSVSYGSRTAYTAVTEDGKYLLAANHGSHTTVTCSYIQNEDGSWQLKRGFDDSSAALFSLREDGGIGDLKDLVVFRQSGYWCHGGGQSTSHLHQIRTHGDLVFACNRGADEIEVMRIDREKECLSILNQYHTRSGYAPRYMEFHPFLPVFYVANENYPSVSAYSYDESGMLTEIQFCPTMHDEYYTERPLPVFDKRHADTGEINTCGFADRKAAMPSDIHISAEGRFLYVSNRYYDGGKITVFRVSKDGSLTMSGLIDTEGNDPRGFALSDGLLYAGLLDRNLVQVFRLSSENGLAGDCISRFEIPAPSSFVITK